MKKISIKLIAIFTILVITIMPICFATSKSELKNQQSDIQNQISEKKDDLENVQTEKSDTLTEVENLTEKISDYQSEIEELDSKVENLNASIKENEKRLEKAQEDYSAQEESLKQRLVSMYEAGDTTYLDVLLSSDDFTDLISKWYLVSEIATYDTDMLEKIENQKKEIENAKTDLENNKSDLQTAKSSKQAKTVELASAKDEKDKKVAELSSEEKDIQKEIEQLQEEDKEIAAKIKKYSEYVPPKNNTSNNKNSNNNSNSSGNNNGSANTGNTSSYGFIRPVNGGYIGTTYGASGKYWSTGHHTGVDFNGVAGNPIYAIGDGKVVQAVNNSGSYGTHVMISHGNGIYSFYAHGVSGSLKVSEGQIVSKGQQIMNVGATGNVTGPHLHFEIRTSPGGFKNCINPAPYIPI